MSNPEQRARWHQRAAWLAQLGLASEEDAPVEIIEEVANAALTLLAEVERLERDCTDARRVGRRLYDRMNPEARIALGDVSEWPWLLGRE